MQEGRGGLVHRVVSSSHSNPGSGSAAVASLTHMMGDALPATAQSGGRSPGWAYAPRANVLMVKELVTKAGNTLGLGLGGIEVPTTKPVSRAPTRALLYRHTKLREKFNPYSIPFY